MFATSIGHAKEWASVKLKLVKGHLAWQCTIRRIQYAKPSTDSQRERGMHKTAMKMSLTRRTSKKENEEKLIKRILKLVNYGFT